MKRFAACLLAALLLLPRAHAAPAPVLQALGDSIASGYGVKSSEQYVSLAAGELGCTPVNDAVSGADSLDMLTLLRKDEDVRRHTREAAYVVVSIGGNDFLELLAGVKSTPADLDGLAAALLAGLDGMLERFAANLSAALAEIRKLNPGVRVAVQTLYPIEAGAFSVQAGQAVERLNTVIRETAASCAVAEVAAAWSSGLLADDAIHPSAAGHRVIAAVVADTLRAAEAPPAPLPAEAAPQALWAGVCLLILAAGLLLWLRRRSRKTE